MSNAKFKVCDLVTVVKPKPCGERLQVVKVRRFAMHSKAVDWSFEYLTVPADTAHIAFATYRQEQLEFAEQTNISSHRIMP